MTDFAAGKEILSYCSKCKLPLAHIIVSMKDENSIGKVVCGTCKGTHAYKDPALKSKKVKAKKTATKRISKKSVSITELWTSEIGKVSGEAKPYTIRASFLTGDLLDHKSFGPGIVQEVLDDKIEVLFQHEIKLLVHGK